MDIAVKEAKLTDAFEISEIARDTFPLACPEESDIVELKDYSDKNLNASVFEKLICAQDSYVAYAHLKNEIAGFIVLIFGSICPDFPKLKLPVELQKFYIKPKYHGKEVAMILMNHVISACKKRGYKNVWLSVFSGNRRAMYFYSKFGFLVVGQTNFIMGSETHLDNLMIAEIA